MGWAFGIDPRTGREIGYGVPANCDDFGCPARIDRGLAFVCGGEPYGGDRGCGDFFCDRHLFYWFEFDGPTGVPAVPLCWDCALRHGYRQGEYVTPSWSRHAALRAV